MTFANIKWAVITVFIALLLGKQTQINKTLPSFYRNPPTDYPLDFYPNGADLILPMGTTRYWLFGNLNGKKVILIHGITTGAICYEPLARVLADKGHHVLVFDLWGRGFSDAPFAAYDESLYTTQVALLLQKVGWTSTDVVGVSLGGAIATSFTAFYPAMVNKLVLIAPAGLMKEEDIPYIGKVVGHPLVRSILLHPWIKDISLKGIGRFTQVVPIQEISPRDTLMDKIKRVVNWQLIHHSGFLRAFLGTLGDYPLYGLNERYATVGKEKERKVLVLWGKMDTTVPYKCHSELKEYIQQAEIIHFNRGGHDILISERKKVNDAVYKFLK